jgi:hypothetical protein
MAKLHYAFQGLALRLALLWLNQLAGWAQASLFSVAGLGVRDGDWPLDPSMKRCIWARD